MTLMVIALLPFLALIVMALTGRRADDLPRPPELGGSSKWNPTPHWESDSSTLEVSSIAPR